MRHQSQRSTARSLRSLATALLLVPLGAGGAYADPDDRAATPEELERVRSALESRGYSDVRDLEVDDGHFEVEARNALGEQVDLELDLTSLAVLEENLD